MFGYIIAFLIAGIAIATIVFNNNQLRKTSQQAVDVDLTLLREAIDYSIYASSTTSPLVALDQLTHALTIVQLLQRRYGVHQLDERSSLDTVELREKWYEQKLRILKTLSEKHPDVLSQHLHEKYRKQLSKTRFES